VESSCRGWSHLAMACAFNKAALRGPVDWHPGRRGLFVHREKQSRSRCGQSKLSKLSNLSRQFAHTQDCRWVVYVIAPGGWRDFWNPKVYFGYSCLAGMVAGKIGLSAPTIPMPPGQRVGICRDSAREMGKCRLLGGNQGLDIENLRDRLRNPNCKAVWEATWMWIVWFIGAGSRRRKVTVWLPLVPKEPAACGIGPFPEWSTEAKRGYENNDR